jgi:hypothetical protein
LWDDDLKAAPRTIEYKTNRLVIVETTDHSWHSVGPIVGPMPRVNFTTYFYAPHTEISPSRLTHFAPWPGARRTLRDLVIEPEFQLRSLAAHLLGKRRLKANKHVYSQQTTSSSGSA